MITRTVGADVTWAGTWDPERPGLVALHIVHERGADDPDDPEDMLGSSLEDLEDWEVRAALNAPVEDLEAWEKRQGFERAT